jgi:hypothetical protein
VAAAVASLPVDPSTSISDWQVVSSFDLGVAQLLLKRWQQCLLHLLTALRCPASLLL